jgi:L-seryl-tRNA(Ser) seleniumtransferase
MATKPSDLFARLPSANELLEKPPVRALADRWNRSTVAAGVRSFLNELRSDLERRAADFQMPSLRELAERAARHVAALQQSDTRPAINATGRFFSPEWLSTPLADEALERMIAVSRGCVHGPCGDTPSAAAARVRRLTGAEAALFTSSYSGAVSLALAAIDGEREALVARGEVGLLADGGSLSAIALACHVRLHEIGAVNRSTAAEFESAITDHTAAILRHTPEAYHLEGDVESIDADSLVGLSRDRELPLVELLGSAPLVSNVPGLTEAPPSAAERVAAGAGLVILRGDGLVGGPRCGILLGTRQLIARIETHPLFPAWQADQISLAALDAVLAVYDDPQRLTRALPLYQLLATSVENLRQRAERLAPQIAQATDIEYASAIPCESSLGLAHLPNDKLPSFGIALTPAGGELATLEKRLQKSPTPLHVRRSGEQLLIDLRTVMPRQDQMIVELLVGPAESGTETLEESAIASTA